MTSKFFQTLFFFLSFLFIVSCNTISKKKEGVIEFETNGLDEKHPLYSLLPSSATLKYKNDKYVLEMTTMGVFKISIIGNSKTKQLVEWVKFMNINQACIENINDINKENLEYVLKIEETKETKDIIGLKCYKLNVSIQNTKSDKFTVWYTKELGLENCNELTPYAKVKGVLLDYRIKKMGTEMHFVAKSINHIKVDDADFEISPDIKIISKNEMKSFFKDLE